MAALKTTVPLLIAVVLAGACETLPTLLESAPKPSARVTSGKVQSLDAQGARLAFDVEVDNPYSIELPLADLSYSLASDGHRLAEGSTTLTGGVPAGGRRTITLPASVTFADVLAVLESVRPGEIIPYEASLDLSVRTPAGEPLVLPLRVDGDLPVPAVPRVGLERVEWQRLTLDAASAVLRVRVDNPNAFPIDLGRLDYALALAGTPMVETSLAREVKLPARGSGELEVPISVRPRDIGLAAFNLLRGEEADYRLAGSLHFDTPWSPVVLPFERTGRAAMSSSR